MSYLQMLKAGLLGSASAALVARGHAPTANPPTVLAGGIQVAALDGAQVAQIESCRTLSDFRDLHKNIHSQLSPGGPTMPGINNFDVSRFGVKYAFFNSMNQTAPYEGKVLCAEQKSDGAGEKMIIVDGAPNMQEWDADRRFVQPRATGFQINNKTFGNGLMWNEDDVADNKMDPIYGTAKMLGQAAGWKEKELIGALLVGAFSGTNLCFTGSNLISASHSVFGGPAQSNTMGTAVFSAANVKLAQAKLRKLKTYRGDRYAGRRATHLFVGPDKHAEAVEMFALVNQTAGRDGYLTGQGRMEVVCIDELELLSSGGSWFVADLGSQSRPLIFQLRQAVRWREDNSLAFEKKIIRAAADCRFGIEYGDPFSIVGSNPA